MTLLVLPWGLCRLPGLIQQQWNARTGFFGGLGLSLVFLFTAVGHFARMEDMMAMLPARVPFTLGIALLSGVMEVFFAVALLLPRQRRRAGWLVICLL